MRATKVRAGDLVLMADRRRWAGVDLRELPWRATAELDPLVHVRRARRLLSGQSHHDALSAAVSGKRVLVTGASAGIGRVVAERLGAAGAEVLVVARRRELLDDVVTHIATRGGRARSWPCDLSDLDAVDALAADVLAAHDHVDVLVNNAARSIRRSLARSEDRLHDFDRVMRLNYFGAVHLTMPLVARMRKRGDGHVVNVSTLAVQFGPEPRFAAYLASKAALGAFTRSAAPETLGDGVRWTTVHLPLVRTDMITPSRALRSAPALSVASGADMVVDAVVRRPTRVGHPLGVLAHLFDLAAPAVLQEVMRPPRPSSR
ncbi:MAG: SDR family NAD(P)-dependent oxidoreductase [Actinomycetota bacterium]|nr:SDR family NAD(P)-dependent oxidoreductase [Actinomycetota bacterium]